METISVTAARADLFNLVKRVGNDHMPVQISGNKFDAILIGREDYSAIEETLYLLNIKGMRDLIVEGINTPVEDCGEEIDL